MNTPQITDTFNTLLNGQQIQHGRTAAAQIAEIDISTFSDYFTIADLPKITLRGKKYVVKEWFSRKRQSFSWIHDFGILLIEVNNEDKPLEIYWLCDIYNKKKIYILFNTTVISGAARHLERKYR